MIEGILRGSLGLLALIGLALLFSENRRSIPWKTVGLAIVMQLALAALLLKVPASREVFLVVNRVVFALEEATQAGTSFVFGYLGGGDIPFDADGSTYILAFRGLPLVLVASALSALLFYWRVLPLVVRAFAWALRKTLGVGGAEGVGAAANVFLGMVESPIFVRPYLPKMHRGELFCLMACGMATIAGTVMVLYASFLNPILPDALAHLLIASILSAPAAIAISRIMVPTPRDLMTPAIEFQASGSHNALEAVTNGSLDGVKLLINIVAMLIVFIALVSLINQGLEWIPEIQGKPVTLQRILGLIMAPIAWLIGIPWHESVVAGNLLGTRVILNELVAYLELSRLPRNALSVDSRLILTYAMCGFANFGSLGIMIGGLGGMVPERRWEVVALGIKSIIAGTIATCMTGAVVGMVL